MHTMQTFVYDICVEIQTIKLMYKLIRNLSVVCMALIGAVCMSFAQSRTFAGFEIDLTKNPVGDLPAGVTQVSYPSNGAGYNGDQHGWQWYAIQFEVDGAVKVTLEGCNFQNGHTGYVNDKDANKIGELNNDKCGEKVTWTYNSEESNTLTVYCGQYCPYIKVEAVDYVAPIVPTQKEVALIKTSFADWNAVTVADKAMDVNTKDVITKKSNETITFTLTGVSVYPKAGGKVSSMLDGYLCAMKQSSPNNATIETSKFNNITTVSYYHCATGSSRGWGLLAKGDGDEKWDTLYSTTTNSNGTLVENIAVNRTNVQLRWFNLSSGNYAGLSNLVINGLVDIEPRSFTDFKVDFRSNPYTVVSPAELPEGVAVDGTFHDDQHGYNKLTMNVAVDGPVKFTFGACGFGNNVTVKKGEEVLATVSNNGTCDSKTSSNNFVNWIYNVEEPATLTFELNGYLPFFFAEACDYIEQVEVTYYDVDGKTKIGSKMIDGSSALVYAYGATDVTVAKGKAFRGWFNDVSGNALKVTEGTIVDADLKLYAKTTDIETVTVGSVQVYDMKQMNFYPEDHETISVTNGKYHDKQHGFDFTAGGTISIQVAGNAQVVASLCRYSKGSVVVKDEAGNKVAEFEAMAKDEVDGAVYSFNYVGEATTLTFTFDNTAYVHDITVYNVESFVEKDEKTGWYIIPAGDASSFLMALNSANVEGGTIFLPNGTYDLGTTALSAVSSNVSIIGESMEGVVIKNRPVKEGIAVTATLLLTGNNIYIQDVTLDCVAPYGTGDDSKTAERSVTIQDKGTKNILKNVYLKGVQDTYYSNGAEGMVGYFENCKIQGTVDFICGSGSIFFQECQLMVADRTQSVTSANVITAPSGYASEKGYVFNDCTIDATSNQTGKYNLGRPWNNHPAAAFINTTVLKTGSAAGWTKMNEVSSIRFHEFGTIDANGAAITGHNLDECQTKGTKEELYLTSAEGYAIADILGDWSSLAQAAAVQATVDSKAIDADALYLIENKNGEFVAIVNGADFDATANAGNTIRKANARGGFGKAVAVTSTPTALAPANNGKEVSSVEYYSLAGHKLSVPVKGLNIVVTNFTDGSKSSAKTLVK